MTECMTVRPSIDPESPTNRLLQTMRKNEMKKRMPKYEGKDYAKMYRTLKKFRQKQITLLDDPDIEDPDPYDTSYVFYCFTGKLKE